MNHFQLNDKQVAALIDILKEDCEASGFSDVDFTDADHMEFLAMRAGILRLLQNA